MKTIALNIETAADETLLDALPEPDVKFGNTKNPDLKAQKVAEAKAKQLASMALDPFYGRVLCATLATRKPNGDFKLITAFTADHGEADVIGWVCKQLSATNGEETPPRLLTFNGVGFDVPFLRARAMLLGKTFPQIDTNPYRAVDLDAFHVDLMLHLHGLHDRNPLSLTRNLAFYVERLLNVRWPYADVDQSNLGKLAQDEAGRRTIAALCEWNTTQTLMLYERMTGYGPAHPD